ncbi:3-keto-5-aminohexanoate cleavage protein [Streptomyces sp. G5(2025)]|uniref:3-keto-5-aminohexanoate cleavage protein n=1 Tax=Streptomyces sp. G5(2025) TaxID=3406628 RepID=UPI003C26CA26
MQGHLRVVRRLSRVPAAAPAHLIVVAADREARGERPFGAELEGGAQGVPDRGPDEGPCRALSTVHRGSILNETGTDVVINLTAGMGGDLVIDPDEPLWGAPADPGVLQSMVNMLPEGARWASFALGRMQMLWVAQSILLGGHVRVGLEDNLYLGKGNKATNAQLVERAVQITESLGSRVATPDEARLKLGLKPRT